MGFRAHHKTISSWAGTVTLTNKRIDETGDPNFQILGVETIEQQMVRVDKIVTHVWTAGGQVLLLPPLCRLVGTVGLS